MRKSHAGQKCESPGCSNKTGKTDGRFCSKCKTKKRRAIDPVLTAYEVLKFNSKRRGKIFDLTIEQFREFCYKTQYIAGKGREKDSFSIDRIVNSKGYTINNIRVLTTSQNSSKGTKKVLKYDHETGYARVQTIKSESVPEGAQPF